MLFTSLVQLFKQFKIRPDPISINILFICTDKYKKIVVNQFIF